MTYSELLEDTVRRLGGCGLYQWLLSLIVQLGKTTATWSMITMTFSGQDPGFRCLGEDHNLTRVRGNDSEIFNSDCRSSDNFTCSTYIFDPHMVTIVSEWNLVCDLKWVTATITTILMAGVLVGCLAAGHVADHIGRKPTFFLSIFLIVVFNLVAYFCTSWVMYAAVRCCIGIGVGFYFTVQYSLTLEFAASKWRPVIVAAPSFALEATLYALLAWGLHDWKKIHLAITILGVPFLFTWWFVPESFRWLMTKEKFEEADAVISVIAKVNRRSKPDVNKIIEAVKAEKHEKTATRKYSALDLFHTRESIKTTLGLLFIWFSASYGYYGITFGVKRLSGDLYLNMFLINIVEAPAMLTVPFLVNWMGRKKTCVLFYVLGGLSGLTVGTLQYIDSPVSGQVTNIIALVAKIGVAVAWQAMIVFTTEVYPTVVRTIAYGVHSTAARVGGMVAPQIVFLDDEVPGLLYFLSGVLMVASAGIMLTFRETKDAVLGDSLEDDNNPTKNQHTTEIEISEKL